MLHDINIAAIMQGVLSAAIIAGAGSIKRVLSKKNDELAGINSKLEKIDVRLTGIEANDASQNEIIRSIAKRTESLTPLIRYRIKVIADKAKKTGHITELDYNTAHSIYAQYREMGGNGEITGYMEKINEIFQRTGA